MCGILGGSCKNWNFEMALTKMLHRGPDKQRILRGDRFSLAFARLSIVDLTDFAMQPMISFDGNVVIVYNGEIYGYESLKRKLKSKYRFVSDSDTEVILYAYMEYGDKFIDYIDGIFSIALYDKRNGTIRLFRDRAGVKPLYYYFDGYHFAFASELKGINTLLGEKNLDIDYTALYDYLTYAYIPAPKTMYKNVRQLKPAHKIIYRINEHRLSIQKRYWRLEVNAKEGQRRKDNMLAEELRGLIHESVKSQMIADVPIGTFLSGGVDSSIITYESLTENPDLETFSIGFLDRRYDESKYYKLFSQKFGNRSNEQIFSRKIFNELRKEMSSWFDEPFADTSAFPTYLVSQLARKKVTVVLTGDGGDELFGGYAWYNFTYKPGIFMDSSRISQLYENIVSINGKLYNNKAHELFSETLQKFSAQHGYMLKYMKADLAKKWGITKDYDDYWFLREYDRHDLPIRTRLQYIDFCTYLPEILTKVDRASMQLSLEARVPFLSRKIIEFIFSMTQEERFPNGEIKYLLRKAYPEIPKSILYKKKQGFCMPGKYLGEEAFPNKKLLKEVWDI